MKSDSSAFHIDDVKIEGVSVSGGYNGSAPSQKPTEAKYDPTEMEVSEARSLDSGLSECSRPKEQKIHSEGSVCDDKVGSSSQLSTGMINTQVDVKEFACFACGYKDSRVEDVVQHILSTHPSPQPKSSSLVLVQQPNTVAISSIVQQEHEPTHGAVNNVAVSDFIGSAVKLEVDPLQVEPSVIKTESRDEPQSYPIEVQSTVSAASQVEKNFAGEACKICGHVFLNNGDAEQHMNVHWDPLGPIGTKRFPCIVCDFRTKEKSCLTRHLLTHFGRKPFACDVCGSRFNRKDSLMKHLRTHTRMKQQPCSTGEYRAECESSTTVGTTSSELTNFSIDYESNNATDVEPHVPSVESSRTFETAAELADRTNSIATLDGYVKTTTLEHTDDVVMSDLKTEPSNQLDPILDEPVTDPLQMEQTEEQSQDSDPSCIFGVDVANNGKPFVCSFCAYETRKKCDFVVHTRTHTGETPFACDLCDKRYIARKTLNRHKKVHHGENVLACGLCDYRAVQKSDMDEHVRSHHGAEVIMIDPHELERSHHEPSNFDLNEELSQEGVPTWSYETTEEPDTKRFACNLCDYKTKQKSYLEDHMKTHTGENLFACDFCDRKYTTKRTAERHLRECHGEKLFGCGFCDYRATKKADVTEHIKTHIESEAANHSHDEVKHASPDDLELNELSSGPSECTQPGNDPLRTHFDDAPCESTNEPFHLELSNEHSQDSGVSRSSEAELISVKNKRHTCEVCGYKTSRKYEYTVHMRTHTGEKPYKCSLCDYRTVRKSYVAKHMKTHLRNATPNDRLQFDLTCDSPELGDVSENNSLSEATPGRSLSGDEHFKCEYCDYECDGITAWSQHMFEHTNEKTYNCDDCDYKSKLKTDMVLHKTAHAKAAHTVKITCEFCDYLFVTKDDMSQHIMMCHPEKCPHGCDICDFKAFNARSLELHRETHTKPFACNVCDYRTDEEALLSSHVMSDHADAEEYVCYSCDYKAGNVKDVEQHIFTTHGLSAAETTPLVCLTTEPPSNVIDSPILPQPQVQQYLCYACDYKASELAAVEEHILVTHPTPVVQEVAVPVSSNSEAPDFLTSASSNEGEYFCVSCAYKASNIAELEQHIRDSHNTIKSEPTP